ncbi:isocitrate lyase/PEP mutase family protein [Sphingomonas alba]|uniref:Isocitrate lyase/phosphoenolpyruvate mutase family protein n=1 Tax=Sphingomonas alba TaxID=2908208 RepID=A0ABT0RN76_9SPHN|nr:isocitrate lyase/phosphoenolpyruvate mutase family protein [Sphingomonas alba]
MSKYELFAELHVPGDPVVLYNVWDVGSAISVTKSGAKALATSSQAVAEAHGWQDGQNAPIEFVIENAKRIADSNSLPLSVDFEGAYSEDQEVGAENTLRLKEAGAVGCNFEDQVIGGMGIHPLKCQARRIKAIRRAVGEDFFINARTDLFLQTQDHNEALVDEVIERGKAFADAGASGFFVPRMGDPRHVERVIKEVPLPLNLIALAGSPDKQTWVNAGVARVSHGPYPYRQLMDKLDEMSIDAIG